MINTLNFFLIDADVHIFHQPSKISVLLTVALENGGILGLPKQLIDPRRPEVMSHEARFVEKAICCTIVVQV
jgi:hypothetical protein